MTAAFFLQISLVTTIRGAPLNYSMNFVGFNFLGANFILSKSIHCPKKKPILRSVLFMHILLTTFNSLL